LRSVLRFLVLAGLVPLMMTGTPWEAPSKRTASAQPALATPPTVTELAISDDPISGLVPGDGRDAIYVVGERGLYRSTDGGATWRALGPAPPAPGLAIAADETLLLAGWWPACLRAQPGNAPLFRSRDRGATWQAVAGVENLWPLAVRRDPVVALGTTCAGLQVSQDEGASWRPLSAIPASFEVRAFVPAPGGAGEEAFFIIGTAEGGASVLWLVVLGKEGELGSSEQLRTFWGAGAAGGSRERPVIGTANGVLTSLDSGASWRLSRAGLEDVTLSVDPTRGPIPDAELQRGFGISAVAVDAFDPDQIYVGTVAGVYHSGDGGATWSHLKGTQGVTTALILTCRGTLLALSDARVKVYELPAQESATPQQTTPVSATPMTSARQIAESSEQCAEAA
jgi:hypothetical protein